MASITEHSTFSFEGVIPASKSSFNRAMIVQSYDPKINVIGKGKCDDIAKMRAAVMNLHHSETTFDCGEAGTVLRFMALRVSRETGGFLLTGKHRLFKRPQTELAKLFSQLGVHYHLQDRGMKVDSQGWKIPETPIKVGGSESSQFLSGLLLNCWNLPSEIKIELPTGLVSEDYFKLTLEILKDFGMQWSKEGNLLRIPPHQKPKVLTYHVESDVSSAFAVAALAAVAGQALIRKFPFQSKQPDVVFLSLLKDMGVPCEQRGDDLWVGQAKALWAQPINLQNSPDLFPVMSALAAMAMGESNFFGAPHLKFKESNRIEEVVTFLRRLGVEATEKDDGAIVVGTRNRNSNDLFFDTKDDHRLVMMAAVLKAGGFHIKIQNPEIVAKSFPEFLDIAEGYL